MARISVNTYANLREFTDGAPSVELDIQPDKTVADVLTRLGIPHERTKIIFVNNRSAGLDRSLQDGDRVDLFSAIGGG
jgi:molybdopterin converting factor small subunit